MNRRDLARKLGDEALSRYLSENALGDDNSDYGQASFRLAQLCSAIAADPNSSHIEGYLIRYSTLLSDDIHDINRQRMAARPRTGYQTVIWEEHGQDRLWATMRMLRNAPDPCEVGA